MRVSSQHYKRLKAKSDVKGTADKTSHYSASIKFNNTTLQASIKIVTASQT
jgi:hypothetical protein